jgi:hypothetical protein
MSQSNLPPDPQLGEYLVDTHEPNWRTQLDNLGYEIVAEIVITLHVDSKPILGMLDYYRGVHTGSRYSNKWLMVVDNTLPSGQAVAWSLWDGLYFRVVKLAPRGV